MIVFPNCKINLGLHIVEKREDGYHNLETVFYPLALYDGLEIISSPLASQLSFTTSGNSIPTTTEENICVKAYSLLKKDFPELPAVRMHLHKQLPLGAGLGGGSANAAFTLMLLNQKFQLGIPKDKLMNYGLQLGSDCPFFLLNRPAIGRGRGEILEEISLDLSKYFFALIHPGIHVSTAAAFSKISPHANRPPLRDVVGQPPQAWKTLLQNDFEPAITAEHPEIGEIKNQLYAAGALYAAMTGSGSTVFGIFEKAPVLNSFPAHYFVKTVKGI